MLAKMSSNINHIFVAKIIDHWSKVSSLLEMTFFCKVSKELQNYGHSQSCVVLTRLGHVLHYRFCNVEKVRQTEMNVPREVQLCKQSLIWHFKQELLFVIVVVAETFVKKGERKEKQIRRTLVIRLLLFNDA